MRCIYTEKVCSWEVVGPMGGEWLKEVDTSSVRWRGGERVYNTPHTRSSIIPHPPAYEDGTDREFRNVGYQRYMDAGDLPKRQKITIRKRRKFKIKKTYSAYINTSERLSFSEGMHGTV